MNDFKFAIKTLKKEKKFILGQWGESAASKELQNAIEELSKDKVIDLYPGYDSYKVKCKDCGYKGFIMLPPITDLKGIGCPMCTEYKLRLRA